MDLDSQRRAIQAIINAKQERIKEIKAELTEPFKESADAEPLILPEPEFTEAQPKEHKEMKKRNKDL